MNILIAGGAGFIGSNLAKLLLSQNNQIIVIDNLERGRIEYLPQSTNVKFTQVDLATDGFVSHINEIQHETPIDVVWHLAANSDIPAGVANLEVDLKNTFQSTLGICKAFEKQPPKSIVFASSSAVYGDMGEAFIEESSGPCLPISNYGSMKLASEALLSSWVEGKNTTLSIFRFPNVVGIPATHGVIFDFIKRLKQEPSMLKVLGNGLQRKPYLLCNELIEIMTGLHAKQTTQREVYNIGPNDEGVTVREIAEIVTSHFPQCKSIVYDGNTSGWLGDIPRFRYDTTKMRSIFGRPVLDSKSAVTQAAGLIYDQLHAY